MRILRRLGHGDWERTPIPTDGLSIRRGDAARVELVEGLVAEALAVVLPFAEDGAPRAALLCAAADEEGLLVSGFPPLSVQILAERDELIVGDDRLRFSSREPALPRRYEPGAEAAACARCRQPLVANDLVAACGTCRALHHEGVPAGGAEERRCWSHDSACAACGREREEPSGAEDDA